ncbi:hypothetical protein ACFVT1_34165 [Streptomyces sp. NPDC057963]|uniref:hypothetical protein n=1 Tax=Streptomyces sp. NPDC057963 TaxID=3346290 RepID=UPI0036F00C1C
MSRRLVEYRGHSIVVAFVGDAPQYGDWGAAASLPEDQAGRCRHQVGEGLLLTFGLPAGLGVLGDAQRRDARGYPASVM